MSPRREPSPRAPRRAVPAAILLTVVFGVLDLWTGYEVSVLLVYLLPPALAGWHGGRRAAIALGAMGAAAWLAADLLSGHPYSHPGIPYWNAVPRFAIFAAFGALLAELRTARERTARASEEESLPGAGSFYRMLEREHARLLRHGRPVTLAYLDAGGVRGDAGAAAEGFRAAVLESLRGTLRASDVVARPRGKELALLLSDTGPEAAAVALRRLRGALAGIAEGGPFCVAIGAVSCAAPGHGMNDVIQRAYQLMYQADRTPGQVSVALEALAEPDAATAPATAPAIA